MPWALMLSIKKAQQPSCLQTLRAQHRVDLVPKSWQHLRGECKEKVRQELYNEQSALCVYCTCRLTLSRGESSRTADLQIEHFIPRSIEPALVFTWGNLLGVCSGTSGEERHCDHSKENTTLYRDPTQSGRAQRDFYFDLGTGEIKSTDIRIKKDISILRLNNPVLLKKRNDVLKKLRAQLSRKNPKSAQNLLKRRLSECRAHSKRPPFAPLIAQYCEKKLGSASSSP